MLVGSLIAILIIAIFTGDERLAIIRKQLPDGSRYLGKENGSFVFSMPFGKEVDTEKLRRVISSFLGLHVECTFHKYLYVRVYTEKLKKSIPFPANSRGKGLEITVGMGYGGEIRHDFRKYAHMIVAGHTGYGKTNFLKSLILQLDALIVLIDLKNSGDYPPEWVSAGNIQETKEVLSQVVGGVGGGRKVFVIVDEAAELLVPAYMTRREGVDYLHCQQLVSEIARMGRSRGVHLVYCTQYPTADVVPGQIKQNAEGRLCFRLPTAVASRVALDEVGAEKLPGGVPGRALYRTYETKEVQTFEVSDTEGAVLNDCFGAKETKRVRDNIEIG